VRARRRSETPSAVKMTLGVQAAISDLRRIGSWGGLSGLATFPRTTPFATCCDRKASSEHYARLGGEGARERALA
jgi:hypothetical protein